MQHRRSLPPISFLIVDDGRTHPPRQVSRHTSTGNEARGRSHPLGAEIGSSRSDSHAAFLPYRAGLPGDRTQVDRLATGQERRTARLGFVADGVRPRPRPTRSGGGPSKFDSFEDEVDLAGDANPGSLPASSADCSAI